MFGKERKMMRFPEERSQVSRQRIDETFPLIAAILLQCIEIFGKRVLPRCTKTTSQTGIDHILLDRRKRNPCVLINQFANPLKIRCGERKLPHRSIACRQASTQPRSGYGWCWRKGFA